MTDEIENTENTNTGGYVPIFGDTVRTVIYVLGLVASVVGLGFMMFGDASIGGFISTAAGIVTAGFGVAYNPNRMSVINGTN